MKCIIEGKTVQAKIVEDLGHQGGYRTKAVIYNGKEYIVSKTDGIYKQRTIGEKLQGEGVG